MASAVCVIELSKPEIELETSNLIASAVCVIALSKPSLTLVTSKRIASAVCSNFDSVIMFSEPNRILSALISNPFLSHIKWLSSSFVPSLNSGFLSVSNPKKILSACSLSLMVKPLSFISKDISPFEIYNCCPKIILPISVSAITPSGDMAILLVRQPSCVMVIKSLIKANCSSLLFASIKNIPASLMSIMLSSERERTFCEAKSSPFSMTLPMSTVLFLISTHVAL